jgi:hypothetical protein
MEDDQFDEPLPPLIGVSPLWRLLAVLGLLGLVVLLSVVIVLVISLAQQSGQPFANNVAALAPPAMAVVGAAAGPAADDAVDPENSPYPLRQDLRPAGTFPVTSDDGADEKPALSARREFLKDAPRPAVWADTDSDPPDCVLVSPDGQSMAFAHGSELMAGLLGTPQAIADNGPVAPGGGMVRVGGGGRPAGWMMAQGAAPPLPPKPRGDHPHAVLSGWAADSRHVYWTSASGHVLSYMPQAGRVDDSALRAELALPLPVAPEQRGQRPWWAVRTRQQAKAGGTDHDRTELVSVNGAGAPVGLPRVIPLPADELQFLALSPDGKRLAVVAGIAARDQKPARWRVLVLNTDDGGVLCSSPEAARYAGACWTPDGKAIVYSRSQSPAPPDHAPGTAIDACDLWQFDPQTKQETRLSRGGGFASPSVTTDQDKGDQLFFLNRTAGGVALEQLPLQKVREFAQDQEKQQREHAEAWAELSEQVLKGAGLPGESLKDPEKLKKIAGAFAQDYRTKFKAGMPLTLGEWDRQGCEVRALDLAAPARERLAMLLGVVEGEYLCGWQKGSAWRLAGGPPDPGKVVRAENPFGFAYNPFRPVRPNDKEDGPQSLAEVLYRAEGRPLVLCDDPTAANEALAKLIDPDLARGTDLLKQNQGDEADRVLLEMMKRHENNYYLILHVGTLLREHGRKKALADLLQPLLERLDGRPAALPRDVRLYNLLGLAALGSEPTKAITAFQNALRCDMDCGPAYLNLAQANTLAGRARDARLCLRRYLALFPKGEWAEEARRRLTVAAGENGAAPAGAPQ